MPEIIGAVRSGARPEGTSQRAHGWTSRAARFGVFPGATRAGAVRRVEPAALHEASLRKPREAFVYNCIRFDSQHRRPSPSAIRHYKPSVIRKRRPRCLDAQTLTALAHGRIPSEELERVRQHLPQCSKCLGALSAAVRRRALGERSPPGARGPALAPIDSGHGRLFRGLAVVLSLLALGSSATCWYLDTPVPGGRRALDRASPSDVARGAITGVE